MDDYTVKEGKTWAVVSYLTFIGLIISVIMNLEKRNPFTSFHIRQMLGLILMLIVSNITEKFIGSWIGTALWAVTFVCWVYGIFHAIKGEYKPIPVIGDKFQEWFKNVM
ncbi:DUF4870 domain-containing protein [Mangrovimonas aestuarii]|uniref:DUF4870 domain-containing protein n=1 Tax=Mangrovimonas aestuarii TaxID=3018443 RepID=UPI002378AB30|nr:hypothetical protein [Mangrovimonas aestuarii]